jgi:hypothetical protein
MQLKGGSVETRPNCTLFPVLRDRLDAIVIDCIVTAQPLSNLYSESARGECLESALKYATASSSQITLILLNAVIFSSLNTRQRYGWYSVTK